MTDNIKLYCKNFKRRDYLGTDCRILLKWLLKSWDVSVMSGVSWFIRSKGSNEGRTLGNTAVNNKFT
jgi:hypothetical protein